VEPRGGLGTGLRAHLGGAVPVDPEQDTGHDKVRVSAGQGNNQGYEGRLRHNISPFPIALHSSFVPKTWQRTHDALEDVYPTRSRKWSKPCCFRTFTFAHRLIRPHCPSRTLAARSRSEPRPRWLPASNILDCDLHAISPSVAPVWPFIILKRRNIP
jgi:hypothetical protein